MRHEQVGAPAQLAGLRVWLMAGIARPRAFEELVRRLGARVVGTTFVRDHVPFGRRHFRRAARARPDLLLCTEKDLVRMTGSGYAGELVALACTVQLTRGESHLARALEQVTCSKVFSASSAG
jgi:tetraacyldisaccharide-1-P 4'-kinase